MNLDAIQPFASDYPTVPSTPAIREAVAHQVEQLSRVGNVLVRQAAVDRFIEDRSTLPAVDNIEAFRSVLHVAGEVLVDRAALRDKAVTDALANNGLAERPIDGPLGNRVARFRNIDRKAKDLRDMVTDLRSRKLTVALNYVVSNAAVGKSGDTPELAFGPGRYEDYTVPALTGGETVGIIDTGVSGEIRTDGWLAGVKDPPSEIDPLDVLPKDGYLDRAAGHGTHVAGIVQQVAPGTGIRVFTGLKSDGLGSDVEVAEAMLRAVDAGCRILNLSLGCTLDAGDPPPLATKAALDDIIQRYPDVLIVAAAGNDGNQTPVYPAAWAADHPHNVVSVAGLTRDLQPATWSSNGPWVTASAIAEGIRSTFVEGKESPAFDQVPEVFSKSAWAVWGGTSFAAPQIAGAVARICQQLTLTPKQAWATLRAAGTAIPGYGQAFKILPAVS
ncbi:hypothetical protein GCM10009557_56440 [Virgisporangium ochraceum]|uniref:Peptidase S8/S53 domain-containing protein n=1 Tax=Virgisporangium ochraceum TaxID=65505 RepID=A0A8J4EE43_9ACTN|nr:S8/S53 family peptidase [Virgisporangium ochraceum]GIJ71233.1 hypothetical protein Voc01_061500 [Virgisporangium ochraceum]